MVTVGVDLAAEPSGTAIAFIEWSSSGAVIRDVVLPGDDAAVTAAVLRSDKAGIDCPLGWPNAFVSFISAPRLGPTSGDGQLGDRAWRRSLAWRRTDEVVRETTGIVPLSVAADRIGHTALRCAVIRAHLARAGHPVDRSGVGGTVVEVYPAASLKLWGLPWRGYKKPTDTMVRAAIIDGLRTAALRPDLNVHEDRFRRSDHALDALVAGLTARAAARGQASQPGPPEITAARTEGWIALPTTTLAPLHSTDGAPG